MSHPDEGKGGLGCTPRHGRPSRMEHALGGISSIDDSSLVTRIRFSSTPDETILEGEAVLEHSHQPSIANHEQKTVAPSCTQRGPTSAWPPGHPAASPATCTSPTWGHLPIRSSHRPPSRLARAGDLRTERKPCGWPWCDRPARSSSAATVLRRTSRNDSNSHPGIKHSSTILTHQTIWHRLRHLTICARSSAYLVIPQYTVDCPVNLASFHG